ncbi:hypothetical protein HanXRQr2_Chr08g0336741 [Helianthus annuus]|uniref:Uncharacterized protein n=1 Tax=Helianthus annuus TaxID=4232 RepID=A0A9K3IE24_HELAN|nr:hypothetical protein HanXRQr2_Chr08g0336741 [Helianthus annuus]KAJ0901440.1 hypothetical protein HanPSC8_Chr08g0325331 [Helianthus annuus]
MCFWILGRDMAMAVKVTIGKLQQSTYFCSAGLSTKTLLKALNVTFNLFQH